VSYPFLFIIIHCLDSVVPDLGTDRIGTEWNDFFDYLRPNICGLLEICFPPYDEFEYQVSVTWNFSRDRPKGLTSADVRIFGRRFFIVWSHACHADSTDVHNRPVIIVQYSTGTMDVSPDSRQIHQATSKLQQVVCGIPLWFEGRCRKTWQCLPLNMTT